MKILHLEDNPGDATMVLDHLRPEWPEVEIEVVTTRPEFLAGLSDHRLDVILSDFQLPGFNGQEALALARELRPDVPFIFLSGTIGEDAAVESVRAGAADYLLKDRLQRLPVALRRVLHDRDERQQRERAEEQIREQAELLDQVQDGIVVTSLDYRVTYWNRGAERIFGWTKAEVLGRICTEIFGAASIAAFYDMEKHLATAEDWRGEMTLASKENRQLLADVRVTTVRDAAGEKKAWLKVISDVTERKRLEEQLLRAQRLESLGMLAAGIAHDLNNALAPMLMAGGLLRTRVSDPADIRLVVLLEQSAERGAALVKQIVSFAGGRARERVLLQVKHLVRDIMQLMQDTFPKSIRLQHDLPNGIWTVRGDPTQLHQVLLNLCINARDAMPNGGLLNLTVRNEVVNDEAARKNLGATPGRFVAIEVGDSGVGIGPETIGQIWQPFFTTKAEGRGSGLGLSTARGIVANHGGFMTVQSEPGRGSTFCVYLPADSSNVNPAAAAGTEDGAVTRGGNELVLVVDDQSSVRESIGVVLSQRGYRPLIAADGIEVLSKYADRLRDVALVITDLDMPGLNGVALAQAILHLNSAVKILFISGTGAVVGTTRAPMGAGMAFLPKPFSPDALIAKVEQLLHPKAK